MATPDDKIIAERLRRVREFLGLSQQQVADWVKISRPAVSEIEGGRRRVSAAELARFADLYKYPVEYFLGVDQPVDQSISVLTRTVKDLSENDQEEVLRFAEFLKHYGAARRSQAR
jgi:transcriptional regulator with XRE-family HTH domain